MRDNLWECQTDFISDYKLAHSNKEKPNPKEQRREKKQNWGTVWTIETSAAHMFKHLACKEQCGGQQDVEETRQQKSTVWSRPLKVCRLTAERYLDFLNQPTPWGLPSREHLTGSNICWCCSFLLRGMLGFCVFWADFMTCWPRTLPLSGAQSQLEIYRKKN
jgi:hypothetical protein